jgi:WTAP/Mum2p family
MAKCRMLLQENEELGRTVSSGRLAKLEGDIALQKRLISEMKNSEKGMTAISSFRSMNCGEPLK